MPEPAAALLAFVAGGVALLASKEELPREREGRFGAFLGGVLAAAVLLVTV